MHKPEHPVSRILFTNASIFDGTGSPCFAGEVLVEGDSIKAVGHGSLGLDRAAAKVFDCGGATLMPGLIDGHTHLNFGSTIEQVAPMRERTDAANACLIAHAGKVLLDFGYTSAYSGGSISPAAEVAARDAFASGSLPGPRLKATSFERSAGDALGISSRFPSYTERAPETTELEDFVREMATLGVDSVKFRLNGISAFDPGSNSIDQYYDEEIATAARAARDCRLSLIAHSYTPQAIKQALAHGFNVLYHCVYADEECCNLLEAHKHGIFVGPAAGIMEADLLVAPSIGIMASDEQKIEQADAVERLKIVGSELRRRGVRCVPGGDYGFPWNPIGANSRDIELFVEWFGYTPAKALSAATRIGGQLMGMGDTLGLIKEGFLADLLLVDGNPVDNLKLLRDRDNLLMIMQGGKCHKDPTIRLKQVTNLERRRGGA